MEVTRTCDVAVEPLLLPIRENPVTLAGSGNVWGIPITLGDPSQFFSFRPAPSQNNTFVYNHCDAQNYTCIAEHGGAYSPPANVQRTISPGSWNGTTGRDVLDGSYVFFNDLMTIEGHKIPGFPFYTYQQAADAAAIQPGLGLAGGSTFLRAAAQLEIIPSKQWSYWGGDQGASVEGHLMIGGYDKNRVDGDFTTFNISPRQGLGITIDELSWVSSTGNKTSLLDGTGYTDLVATINPFADYIALPETVRNNFETATGAYIDSATRLLAYRDRPSGSLEITLSNGKVVNLPSQVLFDHGLTYDNNGNANTNVYSFWTPRVYQAADYVNYTLRFGTPFLARQYLMADYDQAKFYLADAKQGTGSAVSKQPLCTGGPKPSANSPGGNIPGKKTNVGAIAGGVVGGVVALVIIGLLAFFYVRRRKKAKTTPGDSNTSMTQSHSQPPPPHYMSGVPTSVPNEIPPTGTVYVEKDGMAATTQRVFGDGKKDSTQPQSMNELPSPTTTFSRSSQGFSDQSPTIVSGSSQGYPEQNTQQQQHTAYIEMPADPIRPR